MRLIREKIIIYCSFGLAPLIRIILEEIVKLKNKPFHLISRFTEYNEIINQNIFFKLHFYNKVQIKSCQA